MATVSIKLDQRRKLQDDTFPIVLSISHKGVTATIKTGLSVTTENWKNSKLIVNAAPNIDHVPSANAKLRRSMNELSDYIDEITESGAIHNMTATDIKKSFNHKAQTETYNFNSYYKHFADLKKAPTKRIYMVTLTIIERYTNRNIQFSDVTLSFLRDFEAHLKNNGSAVNNISLHMRNIRAVFNAAIDDGVVDLNKYPFRKFKIKNEKTIKRNLQANTIKQIRDAKLTGIPEYSRDVFMLIFYLIGINLKDLSYLSIHNVANGRIDYKRHKGGKNYSIKIEPEAQELLDKLKGKKYLINLLDHYANYDSVRKEINKKLKEVAKQLEIPEPISTYYARHSWATIARNEAKVGKDDIRDALGHGGGSVTDIYINVDSEMIDEANRKVLDILKNT